MKRKLFSLSALILVVAVAAGIFIQRQYIRDYYVVQTASQQPESTAIAGRLALTGEAEFLYRASQPLVEPAASFNESCKNVSHEHSIVLGCYTRQRIYIFDVDDERLDGVKEVTAAHELLHAVYERLDSSQKVGLNRQLVATADSIEDQRLKDTIAEYKRSDPTQYENELHSILGTEIAVLPTVLEEHYRQYFTDRAKIVGYAKQYEGAFTELEDQIKKYDAELRDLRLQKESLEASLQSRQANLEASRQRLDLLRDSDPAAYNAAVPAYNAEIQAYNQTIARLKTLVEEYNQIVEKRNALAATQNDLAKQLDSNYDRLD